MNTLNLHGTYHEDVERETIRFIEDNWNSSEEIKIVTGNSEDMRRIIKSILGEYKLNYKVGNGIDNLDKSFMIINFND